MSSVSASRGPEPFGPDPLSTPSATLRRRVAAFDTAYAVRSGDLPVLATPVLLGWCEEATVVAVSGLLPGGTTTVGTRLELDHLRATVVDRFVEVLATMLEQDGRTYTFTVSATCDGQQIAAGRITRVAVQTDRFLQRAAPAD